MRFLSYNHLDRLPSLTLLLSTNFPFCVVYQDKNYASELLTPFLMLCVMNGRCAQPDMGGGGGVSLLNVIDVNQQRRHEFFLGSLLATYGIFQHLSRDTTWMSLSCLLCAWIDTAIDFTFTRRAPQFCPAAHIMDAEFFWSCHIWCFGLVASRAGKLHEG
jgi:hypothetical protein